MKPKNIVLVSVSVLLMLLTIWYFLANEAFSGKLSGIAKMTGIIDFIIVIFLFSNLNKLRRLTALTGIVLIWLGWSVLLSWVAFENYATLSQWLAGEFFQVIMWSLIYLLFYIYFQSTPNALMGVVWFFTCLSAMCCVLFVVIFRFVNTGYVAGFQQVADIFYPLVTIPWVLLLKSRLLRNIGVLIITVLVGYSLKRSAISAGLLSVFIYYVVDCFVNSRTNQIVRVFTLLFMGGVVIFSLSFVNSDLNNSIIARFENIFEDEGSGRVILYEKVVQELSDISWGSLIVGRGRESTVQAFGTTAHNDFLEVLFDFGIIGLAIYFCLHLCLIWNCLKLIRGKSRFAPSFAAAYVIFLSLSLVSNLIIYPSHFIYLTALWGTIQGSLQCQANSPHFPVTRKIMMGRSYEPIRNRMSKMKEGP